MPTTVTAPAVPIADGIELSAIGYGAMSLAGVYGAIEEADAQRLLDGLLERGVTHLDTANVYGQGASEQVLGRFLARTGQRDRFAIASKVGIVQGGGIGKRGVRGDREHIREQIDGSLSRLGVDALDLYYLHRPDPSVPVEESVAALAELVEEGKVRSIGLSEVTGEELRRAHAVHPIAAVQSEWSLVSRDVERYVIPAAIELGVAFVAYSPVSRGLLTDRFDAEISALGGSRRNFPRFDASNLPGNLAVAERLRAVAGRIGAPLATVAVAWLEHRAAEAGLRLVAIPGTRSLAHLDESIAAASLRLDAEQLAELEAVAAEISGPRTFDPLWVSGGREGLIG
ncbi:aldo/keto reductase [Arenivirga flava]|uniref:Oxidoreductase n=1 Tax=Arenivirga flava TaxID=1930060 RepID=A0AA37UDE9_9MICO|nr:aldo/keto reductase [Arenivirga flava]GMA27895.1 oxidoreductase [Arenivirga flava]